MWKAIRLARNKVVLNHNFPFSVSLVKPDSSPLIIFLNGHLLKGLEEKSCENAFMIEIQKKLFLFTLNLFDVIIIV